MATRRPIGVLVLALLFLAWGLRALSGILSSNVGTLHKTPALILAVLTLATAYGLFKMQRWSLQVYGVWVGLVIVAIGVTEFTSGTPVIAIAVWLVLMVAMYVAVGLYLRSMLQEGRVTKS